MGGADTETTVPLPHMTTEEDKPNSSTVEPLMPAPGTPTQRPEAGKEAFPDEEPSSPLGGSDGRSSNSSDGDVIEENKGAFQEWLNLGVSESKAQNPIGKFVESPKCTLAITVLIIINAMYIGIETDLNKEQDQSQTASAWYVVECCFTVIFSLELGLRLYGLRLYFFKDGWNLFDLLLVSTAVADTFILTIISAMSQQDGESDTLDVISAMRIARLLRLARIFRLIRFFKQLWLLISGVINSIRTLAWAWLLIVLIIYIFGILATRILGQAYGCRLDSSQGCDPEMDMYFGTVPESMFTFFQMITTEGWADIARRSMSHLNASWIIFIFFMSLTTFAIMNVVIAVIVENTLDQAITQQNDVAKKLDKERQTALQKIYEVFLIADKDRSGELTKDEFLEALHNADVMKLLYEVEIDMRGAEGLFDILDYDESGSLDVTEFIEGCMRARGDAKAKDVLALQCDLWRTQQWVRTELMQMSDTVLGRFCTLEAEINSISSSFLDEEIKALPADGSGTGRSSGTCLNAAPVGLGNKNHSSKGLKSKVSPRSDVPTIPTPRSTT